MPCWVVTYRREWPGWRIWSEGWPYHPTEERGLDRGASVLIIWL
jgi:hypothetical protein